MAYNPGQPRDPKGESTGGQWAGGGNPANKTPGGKQPDGAAIPNKHTGGHGRAFMRQDSKLNEQIHRLRLKAKFAKMGGDPSRIR